MHQPHLHQPWQLDRCGLLIVSCTGIMLTSVYDYMGNDKFGAPTATSWQQFFRQKAAWQVRDTGSAAMYLRYPEYGTWMQRQVLAP